MEKKEVWGDLQKVMALLKNNCKRPRPRICHASRGFHPVLI